MNANWTEVAKIVKPATGILGVFGLTTTTTISVPLVGVTAVSVAVGYGIYKGIQLAKKTS